MTARLAEAEVLSGSAFPSKYGHGAEQSARAAWDALRWVEVARSRTTHSALIHTVCGCLTGFWLGAPHQVTLRGYAWLWGPYGTTTGIKTRSVLLQWHTR